MLCVTHLPQVAARADWQWQVSKTSREGMVLSSIAALDPGPGGQIALACWGRRRNHRRITRRHARELLGSRSSKSRLAATAAGQGRVPLTRWIENCRRPAEQFAAGENSQQGRCGEGHVTLPDRISGDNATEAGDGNLSLSSNSARKMKHKVVAKTLCPGTATGPSSSSSE